MQVPYCRNSAFWLQRYNKVSFRHSLITCMIQQVQETQNTHNEYQFIFDLVNS